MGSGSGLWEERGGTGAAGVALGGLGSPLRSPQGWREMEVEVKKGRRKEKARLTQQRNLIRAELYSPVKDIGYFRDIGKK